MMIEDLLVQQLRYDEGVRFKPYRDTVGKLTIGVGRNLDDKGINQAEADLMLQDDIDDVLRDLKAKLPWTDALDDARRGVLANMAFNMGIVGLLGFTRTLAMIQAGNYSGAADAMLESTWAKQVGNRATRLSNQMRSGEWHINGLKPVASGGGGDE